MSYLVRRAFSYAARRIASDPRTREKAGEYARKVSSEIKTIAREEDRAYAAGRSVRRLLGQWREDGERGRNRDDDSPA